MLAGLPEDALLARPLGQTQTWTTTHELLASAVEVISVGASDRRLKKPLQIPRPHAPRVRAPRRERASIERAAGAVGLGEAMASYGAEGRLRVVPPPGEGGGAP